MKKLLVMAFVLLVGTRVCMASVLFEDTFDSASSLNNWDKINGEWTVKDGALYGKKEGYIYAGDTSWGDYSFETTADFIDGNANLMIRSTGNWQNEYRLILYSDDYELPYYANSFKFMKYSDSGGEIFSQGSQEVTTVPITKTSTIKVIAMGNNFQGYVNNQKLFEYTDDNPLLSGRIGVGVVYNYGVAFDNVRVSSINPNVVPEPTSMLLYGLGGGVLVLLRRRKK